MDGQSLLNKLNSLLLENSSYSRFIDEKTSYDYLYAAAVEFARRTKCLTGIQTITTVASQANYDLAHDFAGLYVTDTRAEMVVKFNDGNADYWVKYRPYDAIYYANTYGVTGATAPIPYNFGITDKATSGSRITGTASSGGTASMGECALIDATAPFANVSPGDSVYNITDASGGVVLAKVSSGQLTTALFGGTGNDWTLSDSYVVVSQGLKQIVLDPPPTSSGCTLTVPYLAMPSPVYSPYGAYRFDSSSDMALVHYAAYLYKYRDRDPNKGDAFYKHFDMECRKLSDAEKQRMNRNRIRVTMVKRSMTDRSYR